MNWLTGLKLDHREQRIAFEEMLLAVRQARERIERLEQAMREAVAADWTLAPASGRSPVAAMMAPFPNHRPSKERCRHARHASGACCGLLRSLQDADGRRPRR